MLNAKQRNYWYHCLLHLWYDAVLDWGLNPGPPALDASTLPLGYRGGGILTMICSIFQVSSANKLSPDTEENVIGETEDIFKNFIHESYKRDSDREALQDEMLATPRVPLLKSFSPDPLR